MPKKTQVKRERDGKVTVGNVGNVGSDPAFVEQLIKASTAPQFTDEEKQVILFQIGQGRAFTVALLTAMSLASAKEADLLGRGFPKLRDAWHAWVNTKELLKRALAYKPPTGRASRIMMHAQSFNDDG